jgi:GDP-4-dehydro-6-deoxy-D-mannose reductase
LSKVLVTGAAGFTGRHLLAYLDEQGCDTLGTSRTRNHVVVAPGREKKLRRLDILDRAATESLLREMKPAYVFHLAAATAGRTSGDAVENCFRVNVLGTIELLEAARKAEVDAVLVVPGSSAQFGLTHRNEMPVSETNPYRPLNHYGLSKVSQGALASQYASTYGMRIVRTHTFNCIGPGQSEDFAPSDFCRQVVEIERGLRAPVLEVGNLGVSRDYTDVRDVVRAYWQLAREGRPGEVYNVCSGRETSIDELVSYLLRISTTAIELRQAEGRLRGSDVPFQVGDGSKIRRETGWNPEIAWEESLLALLEDWRGRTQTKGEWKSQ